MWETGASPARAGAPRRTLTVGVEEEFVLADARTRAAAPMGQAVIGAAGRISGVRHVTAEMAPAQVETVSAVCRDGRELYEEVRRLRECTAREAARHGCLLVAAGTQPLGDPGPPPVLDKPRYLRIAEWFGPLVEQQCVNACHVHVGVPDREEAVRVVNHLRPWTPLLLALSANSPYWRGHDTGHASWRTMLWGRWPTAGPPPYLRSAAHYEELVGALVDSGAAMDTGMVYWSVRPSRHLPTVEIRVADVMPTLRDTIGFALLVRALTAWALARVREDRPAPPVEESVLRAACWRAARDGLAGQVLAVPVSGPPRLVAARDLVPALLRRVRAHLRASGDEEFVRRWLTLLRDRGTGAARQRAAYRRDGRLRDVVDAVCVDGRAPAWPVPAPPGAGAPAPAGGPPA